MNGSKLYERLRKEHSGYCKRKKVKTLKAVCEYIEARIEGRRLTVHELYMKYGIGMSAFYKRLKEIVKLLKLEEEADWRWKDTNQS